jgi:hypothetical protein
MELATGANTPISTSGTSYFVNNNPDLLKKLIDKK